MKIVVLSGSVAGTKTRAVAGYTAGHLTETYPDHEISLLDLAEFDIDFSDGRNYLDYTGDTGTVVRAIMAAEVLIVASPVYQASIPGALKNVLDLLPADGLTDTVVSMIVTAGSVRHSTIPETHFKPIFAYLKAHVVANYVFIEEKDIHRGEIIDDDVYLRIERLVDDTLTLAEVHAEVRARKDAAYGF
ncbi:MAG: NAD(P)H-dependent oxidoreductase [Spirochaeta sp.]|jgi:FMN reductase|nr:NAD(P)H-dependent oxidoreductase [Spirochaeta sp.]